MVHGDTWWQLYLESCTDHSWSIRGFDIWIHFEYVESNVLISFRSLRIRTSHEVRSILSPFQTENSSLELSQNGTAMNSPTFGIGQIALESPEPLWPSQFCWNHQLLCHDLVMPNGPGLSVVHLWKNCRWKANQKLSGHGGHGSNGKISFYAPGYFPSSKPSVPPIYATSKRSKEALEVPIKNSIAKDRRPILCIDTVLYVQLQQYNEIQ